MHDSVYEIAGDPRLAKFLRTSLTTLANGSEPLLRELAEGVLSGRVNLREAVASDAYGEALSSAFERFSAYYDRLDGDEKERLTSETAQQLDDLLDERHPKP